MRFRQFAYPVSIVLFEGEGAAAPAGEGAQGETQASAVPTRPGKKAGEYDNVLFGKQPEQKAQAAAVQTTSDTLDARRAQWRQMIQGEYKDMYTADTQRLIDRRFRETKELQSKVDGYQPIIDVLSARYGESDPAKLAEKIDSDTAYWSEAADEAGMTVEQYKAFQKLERENKALMDQQKRQQGAQQAEAQLQRWYQEGEEVAAKYPGFDLAAEVQNPDFVKLLKSGTSVEHAFKVIHMDELMSAGMSTAATRAEERIVSNIRARGARPPEAGTAAQGGFTVKDDVSKLTKKDRAEIARRAMMGERITF